MLETVREVRTVTADSMTYGFGWAIGPSGQMFLNGRLPGYRTALLVIPEQRLGAVGLAADSVALPAVARVLSDAQVLLTGDELGMAIDSFAA
jgi:NADPH-dependent ferric siderophore reductase